MFVDLDKRWGPHTTDQFADTYSRQISCFNYRFLSPGSEAVDAFTCNWEKKVTGGIHQSTLLPEYYSMLEKPRPMRH